MQKAIEQLSEYGAVRTCKVVRELVVTIVLTDGFSTSAVKTAEFMMKCHELFPEFPILETCVTEDDLAIVVLTK